VFGLSVEDKKECAQHVAFFSANRKRIIAFRKLIRTKTTERLGRLLHYLRGKNSSLSSGWALSIYSAVFFEVCSRK